MNADQQRLLIDNLVGAMRGATREGIIPRPLGHFKKVDPRLAEGLALGLGVDAGAY